MKKITWLAVGLIAAALGMAITYGIQRYQHDQAMTQVDFLLERQAIAQKLILGFTEYRRQSATFRVVRGPTLSMPAKRRSRSRRGTRSQASCLAAPSTGAKRAKARPIAAITAATSPTSKPCSIPGQESLHAG